MIAAINKEHKVVWGIGINNAAAIADALKEAAQKRPAMETGKLQCVPLKHNAPLDGDGYDLFEYCELAADKQTVQLDMF